MAYIFKITYLQKTPTWWKQVRGSSIESLRLKSGVPTTGFSRSHFSHTSHMADLDLTANSASTVVVKLNDTDIIEADMLNHVINPLGFNITSQMFR